MTLTDNWYNDPADLRARAGWYYLRAERSRNTGISNAWMGKANALLRRAFRIEMERVDRGRLGLS